MATRKALRLTTKAVAYVYAAFADTDTLALRAYDELLPAAAANDVTFLDEVMRKARNSGKKIHLGRLFDICVLKGSELQPGHVNRKWKGRVVFGGNNVNDEFPWPPYSRKLAVGLATDQHRNF